MISCVRLWVLSLVAADLGEKEGTLTGLVDSAPCAMSRFRGFLIAKPGAKSETLDTLVKQGAESLPPAPSHSELRL